MSLYLVYYSTCHSFPCSVSFLSLVVFLLPVSFCQVFCDWFDTEDIECPQCLHLCLISPAPSTSLITMWLNSPVLHFSVCQSVCVTFLLWFLDFSVYFPCGLNLIKGAFLLLLPAVWVLHSTNCETSSDIRLLSSIGSIWCLPGISLIWSHQMHKCTGCLYLRATCD